MTATKMETKKPAESVKAEQEKGEALYKLRCAYQHARGVLTDAGCDEPRNDIEAYVDALETWNQRATTPSAEVLDEVLREFEKWSNNYEPREGLTNCKKHHVESLKQIIAAIKGSLNYPVKDEGYFLTATELEQLLREAWEAGSDSWQHEGGYCEQTNTFDQHFDAIKGER